MRTWKLFSHCVWATYWNGVFICGGESILLTPFPQTYTIQSYCQSQNKHRNPNYLIKGKNFGSRYKLDIQWKFDGLWLRIGLFRIKVRSKQVLTWIEGQPLNTFTVHISVMYFFPIKQLFKPWKMEQLTKWKGIKVLRSGFLEICRS